ncbi:MAG: hypothetical protein JSV82_08965 [Planctomycetota bacterium]|nr:MAG: hypothetical protein JSV82_08965 [Planctomycetota bacterium]
MSIKGKTKHILVELKGHWPFTLLGAMLGIFFMVFFKHLSGANGRMLFVIFHPTHVVLSALVTASMFRMHAAKKRFVIVLLIGYFGSVGIATISDVVIPHIGAELLGLHIPSEAQLHLQAAASTENGAAATHTHFENKIHFGFIEEWYIVSPAALLGVIIAYFLPRTKFPHSSHVLISTWASSSYLLMNMRSEITIVAAIGIFITLFVAVWLPCCISDIVFPLLFVEPDLEISGLCPVHSRHSHPHIQKESEEYR